MPSLRRKAIIRFLFKVKTWVKIICAINGVVKRLFNPSGKVIAFCGLDGAGKTTILDELNGIFVNLLKSKKVYYGYWRPYVLPEIRELFGKDNSKCGVDKEKEKGITIIESEKKTKSRFISNFKLFYFWLDYMLAPFKYGSVNQRGGIVLFDRHFIDMIVHPERFDMNVSRKLMCFLYKFIPKADYTFFLWCTPNEILERKQEFSYKEIEQMIRNYEEVGTKIKNFIPIHTNTSIIKEIDIILTSIAK